MLCVISCDPWLLKQRYRPLRPTQVVIRAHLTVNRTHSHSSVELGDKKQEIGTRNVNYTTTRRRSNRRPSPATVKKHHKYVSFLGAGSNL